MKKGADTDQSIATRSRRRRMVQYLLILVGCVLVIDALVGDKGVLQMLKKRQQVETLERALAAARAENARLSGEVHRLKYDDATLEELARRDLGLIKPGEKLYIVKDASPASTRSGSK